jgi:zinc transport system substrate-binding protein
VLANQDPENVKAYSENADRYFADLGELYFDYDDGLRQCKAHTVVVSHNALSYLAKRYGFEIISTGGFSEGTEVSPSKIAEIIEKMKMQNLRYVFFATLDSPKVAETIAKEANAKTLEFNPIEGLTETERQAGKNYLSIMQENLNNLRIALECPVGQL